MDKLLLEKEKVKEEPKIETKIDSKPAQILPELPKKESESANGEYLNSFEGVTVADIKKEAENKQIEEFESKKEDLIQQQFSKVEQVKQENVNTIEKPNYDLIEENKKIVKLTTKEVKKEKKKNNKKLAGIVIASVLGASSIICVTNAVIIDNLSASFVKIDETYNLNLAKYLKKISNLDQTKNSMEIVETFPEEKLSAGDLGQTSNWFDRLCNFLGGLFGG